MNLKLEKWNVITGGLGVSGRQLWSVEAKIAPLVQAAINTSNVLRREIRTVDNHPREELIFLCSLFVFTLPIQMKFSSRGGIGVWHLDCCLTF